jgi:hypothetical protein
VTVEERLRRAAAEIHARVERRPVPEPVLEARRTRRGAAAALAAVIVIGVVVTAVGLVALVARDTSPAGRGSWVKVPFAATGFDLGSRVQSVTGGGSGVVAVGSVRQSIARATAGVWTSVDGRRWEAVPSEQFGAVELEHVVKTSDGLFVFGRPLVSSQAPQSVWRSRDARQWEPITTEAPSGIRHVVAGGPGLIGAGFELMGEPAAGVLRAAIWTSRDGRDWERVTGNGRRFPLGSVAGLVRTDDGFVAVGSEQARVGAPVTALVVWTSPDGLQWQRIRDDRALRDATPAASAPLAAMKDGLLLVASIPSPAPAPTTTTTTAPPQPQLGTARLCGVRTGIEAAFSSRDGTRWTQLTSDPPPLPGVTEVIAAHGRWLAAGMEGTCEATRAVAYTSDNAKHWNRAIQDRRPAGPGPIRFPMALGATKDGAVVLVGDLEQIIAGQGGPDVWLWTAGTTK